ncbi:MAG: hypothetical protein AAF938_28930, partial [Myxococcota bacterium]
MNVQTNGSTHLVTREDEAFLVRHGEPVCSLAYRPSSVISVGDDRVWLGDNILDANTGERVGTFSGDAAVSWQGVHVELAGMKLVRTATTIDEFDLGEQSAEGFLGGRANQFHCSRPQLTINSHGAA